MVAGMKGNIIMDLSMEMVILNGLMVLTIEVNFIQINCMVKEYIYGGINVSILVNGRIIKCVGTEYLQGKMEKGI